MGPKSYSSDRGFYSGPELIIWNRNKDSNLIFCSKNLIYGDKDSYQRIPCAIMARATFMNPATLAPFT